MIKRLWAAVAAGILTTGVLFGCAPPEEKYEATGTSAAKAGRVYYLNFKPEQAEQWKALAAKYTEETGVPVTVETAASDNYATQLRSEMAKKDAPTLFQVNGPVGLSQWKDYCYDLSGSDVYKELKSDEFALKKEDGAVAGIAYVIETYGLIYNKEILEVYCGLDGAVISNPKELNNFAALKAVAEDMQKRKDELGIKGAFTSAGMDSSSGWRFKTHLANLPVYYEYKDEGITSTEAIKGTYLDNYKQIWDLYIHNATCEPSLLSGKTGDDAAAEFALGEACFYQNGTWAYDQIKGYDVEDEDIGMMPIYIGVEGEEQQGLCTGSENYWCVNAKAKQEDIDATLAFMKWCVTSDEGKTALAEEMGFVCPFAGFTDEYLPDNPLVKAANQYLEEGKTAVGWYFTTMPSEEWKNGVGSALLEYAQGTGDWEAVKKAFVEGWAKEYQAASKAAA